MWVICCILCCIFVLLTGFTWMAVFRYCFLQVLTGFLTGYPHGKVPSLPAFVLPQVVV